MSSLWLPEQNVDRLSLGNMTTFCMKKDYTKLKGVVNKSFLRLSGCEAWRLEEDDMGFL